MYRSCSNATAEEILATAKCVAGSYAFGAVPGTIIALRKNVLSTTEGSIFRKSTRCFCFLIDRRSDHKNDVLSTACTYNLRWRSFVAAQGFTTAIKSCQWYGIQRWKLSRDTVEKLPIRHLQSRCCTPDDSRAQSAFHV